VKILFICSSLEQGKDGVGDYTRRLAVEMIRNGHQVAALTLNDKHITKEDDTSQDADGITLRVLRIPSIYTVEQRYSKLSAFFNDFNPDLVSLQYSGFGFHKYGLPYDMLTRFRSVIGETKLHIMFHELWCGMAASAGIKERILGKLQELFLKLLLTKLKPNSVFTSIQYYADCLKQLGIYSSVVPIFGTISLDEFGSEAELSELADRIGLSDALNSPSNWLILGFFGTVYPCMGLDALIQSAATAATQINKKLGILLIGHNRGQDINALVQNMDNVTVWKTGLLNEAMINQMMRTADIGVVTSAVDGLNKSTTAIAWMERGIPVIVSGEDQAYSKEQMELLGVYQIKTETDVKDAFNNKGSLMPAGRIAYVADEYGKLDKV